MTVFENELDDMTDAAIDAITDPDGPFGIDEYVTEMPYGGYSTYRTDIAGVRIDADALDERISRIGVGTDLDGTALWTPLNTKWRYLKTYLSCRRLAAGVDHDDPDAPDVDDVRMGRAAADGEFMYQDFLDANGYTSAESNWAWLEDKGFIRSEDYRTNEYGDLLKPATVVDVPFHGPQYAFELKPRDWEHALKQARRSPYGRDPRDLFMRGNRFAWKNGYADYAVVVMDADHIGPALDNADEFRTWGVGLASLDRDDLVVHVDPPKHEPMAWARTRLDLNERTLPNDYEL